MNGSFLSGGLVLRRYLVRPAGRVEAPPGLILCHGFPSGVINARQSAGTFPELVDRIVSELHWVGMTFTFRGCGESEGDFSVQGWVDDLRAAVDHLVAEGSPSAVWVVGAGVGGSLALCVAASDPRVSGVGLLAGRADFDDWGQQPRRMLEHSREVGATRSPRFPPSIEEWAREFRRFRPVDAAARLAPRPLLVIHGDDDDYVPVSDARQLAQAHGSAELRVLSGAGHRLRHDPRAIAILLGWLDRQRSADLASSSALT
jgi:pimeloyl-ACP methyl ester carboxylesterase